jgi:hypothetical protein
MFASLVWPRRYPSRTREHHPEGCRRERWDRDRPNMEADITLVVDGEERSLTVDARNTLLDF